MLGRVAGRSTLGSSDGSASSSPRAERTRVERRAERPRAADARKGPHRTATLPSRRRRHPIRSPPTQRRMSVANAPERRLWPPASNAQNRRKQGGLSRCWLLRRRRRPSGLSGRIFRWLAGTAPRARRHDRCRRRVAAALRDREQDAAARALRMACFDQRGRLVVNASTADVPDMMASEGEE